MMFSRLGSAEEPGRSNFSWLEGRTNQVLRVQTTIISGQQPVGGTRLVGLGDVNGDLHPDVGIGLLPQGQSPRPGSSPGVAMVYLGSSTGLLSKPWFVKQGQHSDYLFSYLFRRVEDQNGDGRNDWLLGLPGDRSQAGSVSLWLGSSNTPPTVPAWSWTPSAGAILRVSGVGDIDGDGIGDFVVSISTPREVNRLLLLRGSTRGEPIPAAWTYQSDQLEDELGEAISPAGDIDGDGLNDFVVGAPGWRAKDGVLGRVGVFFGSSNAEPVGPMWVGSGRANGDRFGSTIASNTDFDADGFSDLAIGAPGIRQSGQHGFVQVYRGSADRQLRLVAERSGGTNDRRYGSALCWLPDFNGDRRPDLAVGSPRSSYRTVEDGVIELLSVGPEERRLNPFLVLIGGDRNAHYGSQISCPGDFNGDGLSELVVACLNLRAPRLDVVFGDRFQTGPPSVWAASGITTGAVSVVPPSAHGGITPSTAGRSLFALFSLVLAVLLTLFLWRLHVSRVASTRADALQQERTRIARDLHDQLGSLVVGAAARNGGPPETQCGPHPIRDALDRLVWNLETGRGTIEGFATFIAEYVPERFAEKDIAVTLDMPIEVPNLALSPEQRTVLTSILSEGLTNVLKHAAASQVSVALEYANQSLRLVIADNGRGMDPAKPASDGHGLRNFQRRLTDVGGTFAIHSAPKAGTRLEFVLPLGKPDGFS